MPDAGHSRDDEPTRGPAGASARDPLRDTLPWTFDEDPVAEQLRAWRVELGPESGSQASRAPSDDRGAAPGESSRVATDAMGRSGVTDGPGAEPLHRPVERPREPGPQRDVDAQPPSAPWPLSGLVRRRTEPELIDVPAPRRTRTLPAGRHAAWDVISQQPQRVQAPSVSPAEAANASARTVAFPALDLVPINDEPDVAEYAIEVDGLRKVFKDMVAVDGVSFKVPKGKIFALLGPNGAGKTTVVNMLCTLLRPDGGSASVNGHDVVEDAAGVRRSIMLTGQFAALDESLTGRENLVLFGRLLGLAKSAAKMRAEELLETFSLVAAADKKVGQYSGGMRRRIDIACGLVTEPKVVFLDEPTTGLDPRSRQDVWSLVEKLREDGVTVLLTTQYLEEADMLSDHIVVIDRGRVIAEGTSDELKAATGAAYCEITPAHPAYLPRLRGKLADMLGPRGGEVDDDTGAIAVPAPDGPDTLAEIIRRTEAARIPLADIALRRPSLDEVFLALTGGTGHDDERDADDDD
ncbi:ATP-binding cassette domain-containing protein [Gordonia neofelifaecis]|uniref:Daunorubicin resistance ABC transporter ATPase subunit n=1 Tax=Gordonia neofelifaecis NRRL B-59395 TaxID=644548 RepID=F1YPI3_9ACTN|nr:ATP-binding cassette domain-containing protein [Gordonia neofelifaecis]EGD53378.1 daunorubicin resistance ABC transporter ATPase subunit [Gordonia neofelifaecis NRRL B-59395]